MTATITPPLSPPSQAERFHWTVETFYRAAAAGIFDEPERWELVDGDLWKREAMNPPHASVMRISARVLRQYLEPQFTVMQETPIHLADDSEPEPDVFVVRGTEEDYTARHPAPQDVVLLIEVADATVERDTGAKALLHAHAGIEDYWVSVIPLRQLWVYRNPTSDGYAEPLRLTESDGISPLAAPEVALPVRDLLIPLPPQP